MKFTIENGTNTCSIGLSDIGSYIQFNIPLTTVWYDCRGSVGKYFSVLPYNEEYRETVRAKINENLNLDFTENSEELYELLKPLLTLFKNGNYSLNFYANKEKEFFQYQSSSDNFSATHYNHLEVVFAENTTNSSQIERIKGQHKAFLKENKISKKHYPLNILEYTTDNIYTGWSSFFATQPYENIDHLRVLYYEEKIRSGERPFAIIFNSNLASHELDSSYFILDGHHKLLAYKNLGLYPPLALITHLPNNLDDVEFDAEMLSKFLYPWQMEHLLENWEGKDEYLKRALKNPKSNLHGIIKNGNHEEYHDNGKLKHRAFYINDKVDGASSYWHENGRLKSEYFYNKGVRTGTWKDYYPSGKLQFIQPFNDEGIQNGTLVSYYENGQKRNEQVIDNGENIDGISYKTWFENGDKEAELTFRNGQMIVRKNWNNWGELVNHEVFNEALRKLETIEISPDEKYDFASKNYKNRQKEIKQLMKGRHTLDATQGNEGLGFWNRIKQFFK